MATLADALRGYTPPTESALGDPIVEHFRTLPQQLATNQQAMDNTMASMYKTDMATGQPNPNYRPEAMQEFTQNYMPAVMGSTTAVRMAKAMENAMLPVKQGGLGLPAGNTAVQRAKALGFDTENMWYRGDKPNLTEFNPNDSSNYIKGNIFLTDKKPIASWYARTGKQKDIMNMPSNESQGVYSLFTKNNPRELKINANENSWVDIPVPKAWKKSFYDGTGQIDDVALMANQKKYPSMQVDNVIDQYGLGSQKVIFNPSDIRSVNAAFDPKRRHEADILAGALAVPMVDEDNRKATLEKLFKEQK